LLIAVFGSSSMMVTGACHHGGTTVGCCILDLVIEGCSEDPWLGMCLAPLV
jgi:hypothetical protein